MAPLPRSRWGLLAQLWLCITHSWFAPPWAATTVSFLACPGRLEAPNPFQLQSLVPLYDEEGLVSMGLALELPVLQKTWAASSSRLEQALLSCRSKRALQRLLSDGLVVTPMGMDFTLVQQKRYGLPSAAGDDLLSDSDVDAVRSSYFPTRVNRFIWSVDSPHWYRPMPRSSSLSAWEAGLLADFRRDGFVRVDQWHGVDMGDVMGEVAERVAGGGGLRDGAAQYIYQDVISLRGLLLPGSLPWRLVHGYLGEDARYSGMLIFRLSPHAGRRSYRNAPWHHDGCGQRLKLFFFLGDVDERTHPTMIARGTHRTHWFPTTHYFAGPRDREGVNKLSPELVRATYGDSITKITGRAGGGFIFDTNALHAADVEGSHRERQVVVLEFSSSRHASEMPRGPRGPEDGFLSGYNHKTCPLPERKGPKFTSSLEESGFVHD